MADIIGSYERLPNDAVRAVAVAKRREYPQDIHRNGQPPPLWPGPVARRSPLHCRSWSRDQTLPAEFTAKKAGIHWIYAAGLMMFDDEL